VPYGRPTNACDEHRQSVIHRVELGLPEVD
jgi:hypothetical protein